MQRKSLNYAKANNPPISQTDINDLKEVINHQVPEDGLFDQKIPGLHIRRSSYLSKDWDNAFYLPSIIIVVQGEKTVRIGKDMFQIESGDMLLIPVALPVALKVIKASPEEPYLGIGLTLEPEKIAEPTQKVYSTGLPDEVEHNRCYITKADTGIIQAMTRLLECTRDSGDTQFIAPIIMDEIIMRLLRSPIGVPIAEMSFSESSVRQIAMAIDWLRNHFTKPMKVSELAELTHMSISVFHKHFKDVTSMSPLQYQKALRLQEARNLMLSKKMDALTASQLVGYASASQFSRDYRSYYGNPPRKDLERLHRRSEDGKYTELNKETPAKQEKQAIN